MDAPSRLRIWVTRRIRTLILARLLPGVAPGAILRLKILTGRIRRVGVIRRSRSYTPSGTYTPTARMHSRPSALYRATQGVAQPHPYLPLPHHLAVQLTRNLRAMHVILLRLDADYVTARTPSVTSCASLPTILSHLIRVTPQRKCSLRITALQLSKRMFYRACHGKLCKSEGGTGD